MSKVSPPVLMGVFLRKRLFGLLDRMRKQPVIWISGPPGCGKTTLVASYLQASKTPSLWYQIDEGDSDPATFFYYLGQAAKRASPRFRKPLPLLTPEYLQGISTFTLRYFENLFDRLKIPSVLVFDNYQEVPSDSPLHEIILNGFSRIPEGINVILVSRENPPPSLIRLRVNHQMEMLRWEDLRLTPEESAGIIRLRAQKKQTKESASLIHKAADGWAAGLVMMLESVERKVIEPKALGRFTPDEIVDYFGNELFNKTDAETQEFFLKTAFLPRMTVKMAEDLTSLPNARRILDRLSRSHYFTEKRFDEESIYQYHPLFRDFLLSRAKGTFSQEDQSILLHRAAILLEQSGQVEEAIPLLRDAGHWEELVELIRKHGPLMLEQGRHRFLREWLESLPKDILEDHPWLLYWMGLCLHPFFPALSRPYFERAFEKFKDKEEVAGIFLTWAGVVNSITSDFNDFTPLNKWIAVLEELTRRFESFPSEEAELRVASTMLLALEWSQPQHPEIEVWAEKVLTLSETCSDLSEKITGYMRLAYYWIQMGNLQKAIMAVNWFRQLARGRNVSPAIDVTLKGHETIYYRYAGLHAECVKAVSDGLKLSENVGIFRAINFYLIHGAASALNVHDLETVRDMLEKLQLSLKSFNVWQLHSYYLLKTRDALVRGSPEEAIIHVEMALKCARRIGVVMPLFLSHLVKSHVMHQLNKDHEATLHLSIASNMANPIGSKLYQFFFLLTEALFAFDRGEQTSGLVSLKRALSIGQEGGFFYTYIDQPYGVAELCERALEAGIEEEYVRELIRRLNVVPPKPAFQLEHWPWPLKIFTLGRFELLKDGKPIQFTRKVQQKPLAMLKALVAFGGKEVREDQMVDALWPESDGDMAHRSLEATLHRLRQLIGIPDAIIRKEGSLTLDQRYWWVDTWAFEQLVREVNAAWKKEQNETSLKEVISLTEKAIHFYRGSFLPKETLEPWADSLRERFRNKFLRCVERLGHHWEASGEWEKAVDCYEQGLEADDLIEEFYQHLMICFQKLGQVAKALYVYKRCKKTISAGLGVSLSPKTEAIYRSLITNR